MTEAGGRLDDAAPVQVLALRAPNPGPLTLSGTVTYVLVDGDQTWVIDPGPRAEPHLQAVADAATAQGRRVLGVFVTHRHADHAESAPSLRRRLARLTGAPVALWAEDTVAVAGAESPPETLESDQGTAAHVIHLPGHTADSIGLLVEGGRLICGDTLLGGSSTHIAPPDGNLTEYLQVLEILRAMATDGRISAILPGHGDAIEGPTAALDAIEGTLAHRRDRIEQVRRARAAGALTMAPLLRAVYGEDLDPALRGAAEATLRATLEHLTRSA